MGKSFLFLFIIAILFLSGCDQKNQSNADRTIFPGEPQEDSSLQKVKIKYAKKFKVDSSKGFTVLTVLNPGAGIQQHYVYVLIPKGMPTPNLVNFKKNDNDIVQAVTIPIKRIVCASTTYIPFLDFLNETETLVGFPGTDYISSPKARKLIEAGKVTNLGTESSMNVEKLLALSPDVVMDYVRQGENDYVRLARKMGIPVVFNADYLEETPLGKAEWIKFMGLLYNKVNLADSIFNNIALRYDSLKTLAGTAKAKPTVFSGIMYGDIWFMPGGENSGAKFIKEAGGTYLWQHTNAEGSIQLSFETVYEKAHNADYWIGVASFNSIKEIIQADNRYKSFEAVKNRKVYSYNSKMGAKGGMTFFELGYARPDLVLADLIKILHPELLPDYELYFYKRLK